MYILQVVKHKEVRSGKEALVDERYDDDGGGGRQNYGRADRTWEGGQAYRRRWWRRVRKHRGWNWARPTGPAAVVVVDDTFNRDESDDGESRGE